MSKELIINIPETEKEHQLYQIIRAQFDLIKMYQEAIDKFEGKLEFKWWKDDKADN
jgi:hypothetical protein